MDIDITTKNSDQLLKAMYDHEIAIGQLYDVFSAMFSDYKEFWQELSEEEKGHAGYLDSLLKEVKGGSEFIVVSRFSLAALDTSIKYVKKIMDNVDDADFELINALSLALHIEEAMIENKYFEVFEGDSPSAIHVLNLLAVETQEHLQKIKEALKQCRGA